MLPASGITVYAAGLHAHTTTTAIRTRHILANGTEIELLCSCDFWFTSFFLKKMIFDFDVCVYIYIVFVFVLFYLYEREFSIVLGFDAFVLSVTTVRV